MCVTSNPVLVTGQYKLESDMIVQCQYKKTYLTAYF
jgi:hypothetical protein